MGADSGLVFGLLIGEQERISPGAEGSSRARLRWWVSGFLSSLPACLGCAGLGSLQRLAVW